MALKTFKPYTKSTRGTILVERTGLWKANHSNHLFLKNSMKAEIIMVISLLLTEREVIKKCIDTLIFIEKNLTCQLP